MYVARDRTDVIRDQAARIPGNYVPRKGRQGLQFGAANKKSPPDLPGGLAGLADQSVYGAA